MSGSMLRLCALYVASVINYALGIYVFANAKGAVHEIEAELFVGFGTLTFGLAAILQAIRFPQMEYLLDGEISRRLPANNQPKSSGSHSSMSYKGVEYINTDGYAVRTVGLSPDKDFKSVGDLRMWVDGGGTSRRS
jgi:hypothetical protein